MSENKTTSKKEETQDKNPDVTSAAAKKTAAASTAKAKTAEELKAEEEAKKKAAPEAAKKEAEKAEQAKIKAAQGESSYVAAPKERHLYHVKLDKPTFSPKDGKKLSKAFIQKFTVQDWKNHLAHAKGLGFTAEVLWNPEEYAKA
jgi:hemolysin activation/secretion protein